MLGNIGLVFNDGFGRAFAAAGAPCVQIHTPLRHLAHTRLVDLSIFLVWPVTYYFWPRVLLILADVFLLAISMADLLVLLLLPLHGVLGPFACPAIHLALRAFQWARGDIPRSVRRSHQKEIAAAAQWVDRNQELLSSSGKLVLCGYSSGGHCAALFGGSCAAPAFEAVVLISGSYGIRTHTWSGVRRLFAPLFNLMYDDILGLKTDAARDSESPDIMIRREVKGQDWYLLSAKSELMGLQPFQDILFQPKMVCDALAAKGANVHRVTCGWNHWDLVLKINDFVQPFCDKMG